MTWKMPVTYQIDNSRNLIRTRCTGPVTIHEVIEHFCQLEKDPDCPPGLDVLLDLSEETTVPTRDNLREVASKISRIRRTVQFGACAIVASTDALFGMLRMFEVFAEQLFHESQVCRTVEEAEDWLASRRRTLAAG
jgi:hypothetical protein